MLALEGYLLSVVLRTSACFSSMESHRHVVAETRTGATRTYDECPTVGPVLLRSPTLPHGCLTHLLNGHVDGPGFAYDP